MGVFNKEVGSTNESQTGETIIGPSVKIEGAFVGEENVLVEGQVMGTLQTKKDLTVAQGAKIEADIEAENLFVSGEILGNIKCHNKIELSASARITGDLETDIISVETGAVIKGRCSTNASTEDTAVKTEDKKPTEQPTKKK